MPNKILSMSEITDHPLLNSDHRKLARVVRSQAKAEGRDFTMLDFAKVCLRATGRDYVEASDEADKDSEGYAATAVAFADIAHKRAAILYTYEALKATDIAWITEWPNFNEMLRCLDQLAAGELP